jgi:N-carbamoyl-L-amino-acid hydrolase
MANNLFTELRVLTAAERGVSRASWASGENAAVDLIRRHASAWGIDAFEDAAGNLHAILAGSDPAARRWVTGSHLDSVPEGGNYDGAAGVVAGLLTLIFFTRCGVTPQRALTLVGFRGEEASSWISGPHRSHLGSRAALGLLEPWELEESIHRVSGLTLRQHLLQSGYRLLNEPSLRAEGIHGFLELHIEQGPVLEAKGIPLGIVTGIRGSLRARQARILGVYDHSGAVPFYLRRDAVFAAAEFVQECERFAVARRSETEDLDITFGQFGTVPAVHAVTKIPGEVDFSIDVRSTSSALLDECCDFFGALGARISASRRVAVELGKFSKIEPAATDAALRGRLAHIAERLGIPFINLPSGGGHDAAEFSLIGIPTAMLFVRNANGSHNPDEQMTIEDFISGVCVLAAIMVE